MEVLKSPRLPRKFQPEVPKVPGLPRTESTMPATQIKSEVLKVARLPRKMQRRRNRKLLGRPGLRAMNLISGGTTRLWPERRRCLSWPNQAIRKMDQPYPHMMLMSNTPSQSSENGSKFKYVDVISFSGPFPPGNNFPFPECTWNRGAQPMITGLFTNTGSEKDVLAFDANKRRQFLGQRVRLVAFWARTCTKSMP